MENIYSAFLLDGNTLPLVMIRYNPDAFRIDGVTERVPSVLRQKRLLQILEYYKALPAGSLPSASFSVVYMYYSASTNCDGNASLDIASDPDYSEAFAVNRIVDVIIA